LARALAGSIDEHGAVLALEGSLGAGKTVFVKGLAEGFSIDPNAVSSPTFVIASEYEGRAPNGTRRLLVHADLFRVERVAELEAAGYLDWIAPGHVVAIEWAERFRAALPEDRLWVRFSAKDTPAQREIVLTAQGTGSTPLLRRWQEAAARACEGAGEWA
jgi:tRNA threonylcarbamoyladenosine biosynthesis protein TsaE